MADIAEGIFGKSVAGNSQINFQGDRCEVITPVQVATFRCLLPRPSEDVSKFKIWCVRPPTAAESAIYPIVGVGGGRTLGYIFPIASFDPSSQYCPQADSDRYLRVYSSAATIWLVRHGGANHHLRDPGWTWDDSITIADLFSPDLSIAVVGRQLIDADIDRNIRLMLAAEGFFPADEVETSFERYRGFSAGSVKTRGFSTGVSEVLSVADQFLRLASRQGSPEASFLFYYQIVESLSDIVLRRLMMKELAGASARSGYDMKTRVLNGTSESIRLSKLFSFAQAVNSSAVDSLKSAGVALLAASGAGDAGDKDPAAHKILYSVRNLIVHNQAPLVGAERTAFRKLIDGFHDVVVAMLRGFPEGRHESLDSAEELYEYKRLLDEIHRASRLHHENMAWCDRRTGQSNERWLKEEVEQSARRLSELEGRRLTLLNTAVV